MLDTLDQQVRDAYEHAHECAERAQLAKDLRERTEWMILEKRYLTLARGIESAQKGRRSRQQRPGWTNRLTT
jgi:hypothetical protein